MKLSAVIFEGVRPVDSYGPGFFRIGDQIIEGGLVTSAKATQKWRGYNDPQPLLELADAVDVILLGTGTTITEVPKEIGKIIEEIGLRFDVMSSPAAARTYNVLIAEGRRVALAAIAI